MKSPKLFWRHFAAVTGLSALLFAAFASPAAPAEPRIKVALMDFTCDDNSQRSAAAAVDFTVRLQAELSTSDSFDWVERNALAAAEKELKLSFLGLTDRSTSLRAGRWAKADWAIHGQWSTNTAAGRTLEIEVLDLQRADVLARTNLAFATLSERPLRVDSQQSTQVAVAVRDLLLRASVIERETRGKPAIALLAVTSGDAISGPIPGLDSQFREALTKACTNAARPFRFIEAIRAGESLGEADLALGGFVDSQEPRRTNALHFFVWGDARSGMEIVRDATGRNTLTNVLTANFQALNLAGTMTNFSVRFTNDLSAEHVTPRLAEALMEAVHACASVPPSEEVRKRASDGLANRAAHLSFSSLSEARSREEWVSGIRWLELACFINPENARARELWTRVRWCDAAYMASANKSLFQKRRSEAWRKYVDKFQFHSALGRVTNEVSRITGMPSAPFSDGSTVAENFIWSAWTDFTLARSSQYRHREMDVPTDTGARDIHEWQRQSGTEFASRLVQVPQLPLRDKHDMFRALLSQNGGVFVIPDPQLRQRALQVILPQLSGSGMEDSYLQRLKEHYVQLGQPGAEAPMVAAFKAAEQRSPDRAQLPRIAEIDPAVSADLLEVPTYIRTVPAEASVSFKDVMLQNVKEVRALASQGTTLWICVGIEEGIGQTNTPGGSAERELSKLKQTRGRLFALDLQTRKVLREAFPFATNDITGVIAVGADLWATSQGGIVARWNPATGDIRWFGSENALKAATPSRLLQSSSALWLMNGSQGYAWLKPETDYWQMLPWKWPPGNYHNGTSTRWAASGESVLVFGVHLALGDGFSGVWTNISPLVTAICPLQRIGHVIDLAGDGRGGFWVSAQSGLHFIQTGSQTTLRSQWLPLPTTIETTIWGGLPSSAIPVGDTSSRFVAEVSRRMAARLRLAILAKDNPATVNPYRPTSRFSTVPGAVAIDGNHLWVALQRRQLVQEGDKVALYDIASRSWVGGAKISRWAYNLHVAGGKLHILSPGHGDRLQHAVLDKQAFLSKPREQWLADEPAMEEIEQGLKNLPRHRQAVARFFLGDYHGVVRLLSGLPVELMSSETLFLLGMAHDELGLNQPAERDRCVALLRSEFPNSVYTHYCAAQQKLEEARALGKERFAHRQSPNAAQTESLVSASKVPVLQGGSPAVQLLKDYDCDGNGGLMYDELRALLESEPDRLPAIPQNHAQPVPAQVVERELNSRDMNGDGQIDMQELTRTLTSARSVVNPSRSPGLIQRPSSAASSTNSHKP